MIDITPDPIAFSIGSLQVHWYGLAYVAAILAAAWIVSREARRRNLDTSIIPDGIILIAVAALIGGRLYHVIDQWAYYKDHLAQIVLPPYSGLGIYGGLALGAVAMILYARWKRQSFWAWADVAALGILAAQTVGRWGNFFNQELYGPPTDLPWGIAIECKNRVPEYACPPLGTTPIDAHFHPLFFYESMLSLLGLLVLLYVGRRFVGAGRPLVRGDVGMLYFVWYGAERSLLEVFRHGYNWTFFGVPTAQVVGLGAAAAAIVVIVIRHWWVRRHPEPEYDQPDEATARGPDDPAAAAEDGVEAGDSGEIAARRSANG